MTNSTVKETTYGYELLWASDENYSGKIIVFDKAGSTTDMIFHKEKRKSIFVNSGKINLKWIDTRTGVLNQSVLTEGQTANIAELQPHQFEALKNNTSITEVGSAELENDVFTIVSNSAKS